jgi:hypothetical protein
VTESYDEQVYVDETIKEKDAGKKAFSMDYLRVMMIAFKKALPNLKREVSGE